MCLAIALSAGHAAADPKKEVLNEVMYCMSFFNGMSLQGTAANKSKMAEVRNAFLTLATDMADSDQAAPERALKETADTAAADIVSRSPEQRFASAQKCAPLLEHGAVERAIAARAAKH